MTKKMTQRRKERLRKLETLAHKALSAKKFRRPAVCYWENFLYDHDISLPTLTADLRALAAMPTSQIVEKKVERGRFHYYAFKIDYTKIPF